MVRGRCSPPVQLPSRERAHPRFIGTGLAGWSPVWAMDPAPQRRAPFRLEAVLPVLVVGRDLEPWAEIFHPLPFQGPGTGPAELAISARLHELPSLDSVTWRKACCPIGCPPREKPLFGPPWALGTSFRTLYGTVICRMYSLLGRLRTTESSENQQSFFNSPSTHTSTSLPHPDTVLLTQTALGPTDVPCNLRPGPQESLFDHALRVLSMPFVICMHAKSCLPSKSVSA